MRNMHTYIEHLLKCVRNILNMQTRYIFLFFYTPEDCTNKNEKYKNKTLQAKLKRNRDFNATHAKGLFFISTCCNQMYTYASYQLHSNCFTERVWHMNTYFLNKCLRHSNKRTYIDGSVHKP